MSVFDFIIVLSCAALAATAGVAYMHAGRQSPTPLASGGRADVSFLFRDCDLQHATPAGAALLSTISAETDWHALRATLAHRFPDLPDADALREIGNVVIPATATMDTGLVRLSREDEMVHVEISDSEPGDAYTIHTIRALQARNDILEIAAEAAPYPIWMLDAKGAVIWHNPRYGMLLETHGTGDTTQPLFDIPSLDHTDSGSARSSVTSPGDGRETWYDVTITKRNDRSICHAVDINAVIQAEIAQRNFVQTLAKTFAQLSIGLAIFDRNGQLALFNPALVDLTSLPVEFLSGRPQLLSFFDRLRDNRVMPEPKNYMSWRHEISDVIAAATHSSYQETWSLDTGHTYRVSGRPHPDGAVAFLIEDITAEISLTRNFRAELELGQSIMDSFEEALVVFSSTGVLTFCNAAYRDMWKMDPDRSFADITIIDSQKVWQERSSPDPAWSDIRDFVMKIGERAPWDTEVEHIDGRSLHVQLSPVVAGATMIRFTVLATVPVSPTAA